MLRSIGFRLSMTALMLAALLYARPGSSSAAAGAKSFVVTCSANHYANVDPFSGSTNSHTHEFFSNAQAWPGVSSVQLGAYVVNINTVTITHAQTGTQATVVLAFDLPAGVGSNPFKANDKIYVSGVDNNGPLDQDVNSNSNVPYGVWIVTGVPSTSSINFKIATNPASRVDVLTKDTATVGLSISQTGTVPDDLVTAQADLPRLMSCGKPRGALTYDSAAYWVPAAYQTDETTHIKPARAKAYYFVTDGCTDDPPYGQCHAFPQGLILLAGNKGAANGPDNPHVTWSCGHSGTFDTPDTAWLPYNCEPYLAAANLILGAGQSIVDGPIGKVIFPSCGSSLTSTNASDYTYPDPTTGKCPTGFRYKFPKLDFREHLGTAWSGTENPCYSSVCDGWDIAEVTPISGGVRVYTWAYAFDSAGNPCTSPGVGSCVDYTPQNLASPATVSINGPAAGYNNTTAVPTWPATNIQNTAVCGTIVPGYCTHSLDIVDPNIASTSCGPAGVPPTVTQEPCGAVIEAGVTRQFYLAGGDPGATDHHHPYYTFHADFWNTWHDTTHLHSTGALTKLVSDCLNSLDGCLPGDINTNEDLDLLP